MINTEYDREYLFDIDAYLIEWYPTMSMVTRRAICKLAIESLDDEPIMEGIDIVVADYALGKQNLVKKEEPEKEEEKDKQDD